MHRYGWKSARLAALSGAAVVLALAPGAAAANSPTGAKVQAVAPGHFRGIVTARTKAGWALYHKLVNRGKALGLIGVGGGNLQYNGGPVMHSDANYAIYWEPSGYSTSSAYKSVIDGYFANVAAASGATTNDYSVTTQYYDGSGNIAYKAAAGGSTVDTNPYPSLGCVSTTGGPCINDAQLQTEVNRVLSANGWPRGLGAMYYVYFPAGVTTCTDITSTECSGTVYCAYHSSMNSGSSTTLYANMAYDAVSGCDSGQHPNGSPADAELNVTSHENIETITDPLGSAWYDSSGQEIGDKCNFNFGAPLGGAPGSEYNEQISSGNYYLQQEWSNAVSGCVQR